MKYTAKFVIRESIIENEKHCFANIFRDGDNIATIYWSSEGLKHFEVVGEIDGAINTLLKIYTSFTKEVTTFAKQVMLLKAIFEFAFDMTENDITIEED